MDFLCLRANHLKVPANLILRFCARLILSFQVWKVFRPPFYSPNQVMFATVSDGGSLLVALVLLGLVVVLVTKSVNIQRKGTLLWLHILPF